MRTVIEEIVVTLDEATQTLAFVVHWKGGVHTQCEMQKPRGAAGQGTALEDLDIIRPMATRYGDDAIAYVLNKLGRRTGKGKRWNQERVATARRNPDTDGDGYGDGLEKLTAHCNPCDGTEIPLQPTIYQGSRGGGALPPNELMTYADVPREGTRLTSRTFPCARP